MARSLLALVSAYLTCVSTFVASDVTREQTAADDPDVGQEIIPNIRDPEAVNPQDVCPGYRASHIAKTDQGITADLTLAGQPCNLYGSDVEFLTLTVNYWNDQLHVAIEPKYISPENRTWFLLPEEILPRPRFDDGGSSLSFRWSNDPTFSFEVSRESTGDVLFTTKGRKLVFADQFIEFGTDLPKNYNVYGLGEVIHGLRLGNNLTRTLFNADVGNPIDANIYGHHPIYYETRYFEDKTNSFEPVENTDTADKSASYRGYTHGVFLRNAHAQEVLLQDSGLTWRTLGGTIDLFFFAGPSQEKITKMYQSSIVGLPAFQQLWTFGFHQCRWGYRNWTQLRDVVNKFRENRLPLETIWTDIDYMQDYRNFENDPVRFGYEEGAQFLKEIHDNHQHYVPIVDSAIYAPDVQNTSDVYATYDRGIKKDAFMLNPDGSLYIGSVWPGFTVFPDWIGALLNGTGTNEWWKDEISRWHEKIQFDGIWIDMSEVSSFCVGSCGSESRPQNVPRSQSLLVKKWNDGKPSEVVMGQVAADSPETTATTYLRTQPTPGTRNINWPPYAINNFKGDLAVHAVSLNATHHGGSVEYDFHNVFGYQILNATYHALLGIVPAKRPFIIGRSQFAGAGKVAGHWGGDNYSKWAFMYFSIPQALSYSLFGIPMFGADACGFSGNATPELCARWMQLSAFFPFYRNHNSQDGTDQEPYLWPQVADASRTAMNIRYALLPYIYTVFQSSHTQGTTTMRALAWEFHGEPWLAGADRQFLLGSALLVTPCLEQGATTVKGVFPGVGRDTIWYDWYNQTATRSSIARGENVTLDAPLGHIPLHVRGGSILPLKSRPALTVHETMQSPWKVLVALDPHDRARGHVYLDDGVSLDPGDNWAMVEFEAEVGTLVLGPAEKTGSYADGVPVGEVVVMGVRGPVKDVKVWQDGQECVLGMDEEEGVWGFDEEKGVLTVTGLRRWDFGRAWSLVWGP